MQIMQSEITNSSYNQACAGFYFILSIRVSKKESNLKDFKGKQSFELITIQIQKLGTRKNKKLQHQMWQKLNYSHSREPCQT